MPAFGKRLKNAWERSGLTQEFVAGEAKINTRTLQRLMDGDGNPTISTLQALAGALGEPLADLLGLEFGHTVAPGEVSTQGLKQSRDHAQAEKLKPLAGVNTGKKIMDAATLEMARVIQAWKDAPDARNKASFLYFLTGEESDLDAGGKEFRTLAKAWFRHHGLKRPKASS